MMSSSVISFHFPGSRRRRRSNAKAFLRQFLQRLFTVETETWDWRQLNQPQRLLFRIHLEHNFIARWWHHESDIERLAGLIWWELTRFSWSLSGQLARVTCWLVLRFANIVFKQHANGAQTKMKSRQRKPVLYLRIHWNIFYFKVISYESLLEF